MSIPHPAAINWALTRPVRNPASKAVLLVLAAHANQDGQAYLGITRLAELTCQRPRAVHRQLNALKQAGLLHPTEDRRLQLNIGPEGCK